MPLLAPDFSTSPSAAAMDLELTSTPEDLVAKERAALESHIMKRDAVLTLNVNSKSDVSAWTSQSSGEGVQDIGTPFNISMGNSPSSPLRRKRLADLKVEVPLTPQHSVESPPKRARTVSFPKELHTLIPQPDSDVSIMDAAVAQQDLDAFITDVVAPLAESAIQQTANEELIEVDTLMRVTVPQVDNTPPTPPWRIFSSGAESTDGLVSQRALLGYYRKELLKD